MNAFYYLICIVDKMKKNAIYTSLILHDNKEKLLPCETEIIRVLFVLFCTKTALETWWNNIRQGVNNKIHIDSSPTMVFSVIGDSDSFVPRPWPKTVFQTALIEAAKNGGGMAIFDRRWLRYS